MDTIGGITDRSLIQAIPAPADVEEFKIVFYDEKNLYKIPSEAYDNGFSFIIIPAMSNVHLEYAKNAPNYENIFFKTIIGWISGIHLSDLGKITPKVFNGLTGEATDAKAIVMHCKIKEGKIPEIGIINIFEQSDGDTIKFNQTSFSVSECEINGKKENFADYVIKNKVDIKVPLVANYSGSMINVSFQSVDEKNKVVNFYAPVFDGVEYKLGKPVKDYTKAFKNALDKKKLSPVFSCNCILNFLYGELEGKHTGDVIGPITFGEIAYQLLNQTLVYLEIK